jgi:hypothetical protein
MTRQAEFSLGGPAVRGKAWFFGHGAHRAERDRQPAERNAP